MGRTDEKVNEHITIKEQKVIVPEKDAFRRIIIQLSSRCTLVLFESEIWQLPEDVLRKAIGRGKAYRRAKQAEKR